MVSMVIWVVALAASMGTMCVTVAMNAQNAHLGAAALVSFGIVAAAVNEHRSATMAGALSSKLAGTAVRYMGLLWGWSAVAAYVVYAFLLDWPNWMAVVVAMFVACGLCLFVALILDREAASATPDPRATLLVGLMAKSQFVLAGILLGGLIALRSPSELGFGGAHRWVALNLVLCTAAGLLTFTGYLIVGGQPSLQPADEALEGVKTETGAAATA